MARWSWCWVVLLVLVVSTAWARPAHHGGRRSSFSIRAMYRPGVCGDSDKSYSECYLCGKIVANVGVYRGCCRRSALVLNFCKHLLS
ncbi:hypothetical protein NP493_359g00016 [Ridgeia piscesae]|uniref:Uncharacterized protein n=1 Tax=Ridgeia piscesae TaxID=27915 RepID=A0AAD9L3P2_RIDPI|nr:hypothetical protein NP493_359g00016 [Ridgeia piscesae]